MCISLVVKFHLLALTMILCTRDRSKVWSDRYWHQGDRLHASPLVWWAAILPSCGRRRTYHRRDIHYLWEYSYTFRSFSWRKTYERKWASLGHWRRRRMWKARWLYSTWPWWMIVQRAKGKKANPLEKVQWKKLCWISFCKWIWRIRMLFRAYQILTDAEAEHHISWRVIDFNFNSYRSFVAEKSQNEEKESCT